MQPFDTRLPFQAFSTVPVTTPLENAYAQARLRAMQQEGQINALKLDEAQRQQQTQADVRNAMAGAVQPEQGSYQQPALDLGGAQLPSRQMTVQGPPTLNRNAFVANLTKTNPMEAMNYQHQFALEDFEQQKQQAVMREAITKADTANLANIHQHESMISDSLAPLLNMPEEQRAQLYPQVAGALLQRGIAAPQILSPDYRGPQQLAQVVQRSMSAKDQAAQELQRRQQAQSEQDKQNQLQTKTVETAQGVMQYNPKTGKYDQKVGNLKPQASMFGSAGNDAIESTADMIVAGQASPVLTDYSFRDRTAIAAALHKRGYDQARAAQDWKAVQRYLSTANGPQQTRIRQAISQVPDLLDKIDGLYDEFQRIAPTAGVRVFNKASLATAKQLPGRPGAVAQALDAQISDLVSDLGVMYMGGNSPTDHALALAQKNLSADWNNDTFKEAVKQIRENVRIRNNSLNVGPAGVSSGTPYTPQAQPAQPQVRKFNPATGRLE